jgi:excisionase family DNA binding protein
LLTITEIGAYLQVGRTTVYKLLDEGMPSYRVGHVTRFDVDEVLAWLRGRETAGQGRSAAGDE